MLELITPQTFWLTASDSVSKAGVLEFGIVATYRRIGVLGATEWAQSTSSGGSLSPGWLGGVFGSVGMISIWVVGILNWLVKMLSTEGVGEADGDGTAGKVAISSSAIQSGAVVPPLAPGLVGGASL